MRSIHHTEKQTWIQVALLVFVGALLCVSAFSLRTGQQNVRYPDADALKSMTNEEKAEEIASYLSMDSFLLTGSEKTLVILAQEAYLDDTNIYRFLQGPKSWANRCSWSGEWAEYYVNGNYFGSFGCGFCCMANIYSTLTPYVASPLDLYDLAIQVAGYEVTPQSGAIGWGALKVTLQYCGFDCDVYYKPDDYATFQWQIGQSDSAIVLVCSANDATFWKSTSGHYVNIWNYDSTSDTVFLAEPGSPTNNGTRISLRYVYDALKTTSKFQYLLVSDYDEEQNQWLHDGIDDSWVAP